MPIQNCALGGFMRAPGIALVVGVGRDPTSANAAITSMATTHEAPEAPSGLRRANQPQHGRPRRPARRHAPVGATVLGGRDGCDPRWPWPS